MKLKMSKSRLVLLAIFIALSLSISVVCYDILRIKAKLDNLYWIAENTHSGMVSTLIGRAELMLHQRLTVLTVLVLATTILAIMSFRSIKHKQTSKITAAQCLTGFLLFVLLTPIVNATVTR